MVFNLVNFRWVDDTTPKVDMDQLKQDYLNPDCSVKDILKKHNISRNEYYRLRRIIVDETGVLAKPSNFGGKPHIFDVSRYISQDPLTLKYRVGKYIKGVLKHYGRYSTLEEAIKVRDDLIEHDWDWEYYLENIKPHCFTKYEGDRVEEIMDDFEKDFLDGMSMVDLREKYGLSKHYYFTLSTSIKHKHGLSRKPTRVKA